MVSDVSRLYKACVYHRCIILWLLWSCRLDAVQDMLNPHLPPTVPLGTALRRTQPVPNHAFLALLASLAKTCHRAMC